MKIFNSFLEILNHPLNRERKIKVFFILIWWKINQLFFKIPAIIEISPNVKCICYPNSSFGSLIVYTIRPEYLEMKLTELILKKDSVFLDVGSGIGDFSLIASSKIITGKIIAFEPSREPLKTLRENVSLNSLTRKIKIIDQVVSNQVGKISFKETSISEISHIDLKSVEDKKKTDTLDNIIRKNNLKKIDLIKIDVEGAESLVLKGLGKTLKRNRVKSLIIELNRNSKLFKSSNSKLVKTLIKHKFEVYIISQKTIKKIEPKLVSENKTVNVLAIHQTFKDKSLINQFLI